jgi:hypothetical protein
MLDPITYFLNSSLKSVPAPYLWTISVFFLLSTLGYRAWRSRLKGGVYEFKASGADFIFETELGAFAFDKDKKSFTAKYRGRNPIVLGFNDIRNIEVITENVHAIFSEIAFEDWDFLTDTDQRYIDVIKKHTIAVITKNHQRYPMILVSQYTIKDFALLNWFDQLQLDILGVLRLYCPVEDHIQSVFDKFKAALSNDFRFDSDKLPYHFERP